MLRGIDSNRIIVGAYVDPRSGGICPMLAAHRNGGRTDVASFARAWDAYTAAKRPRRATRREVRTLRALLVESLEFDPAIEQASIAELAAQLRAEREAFRCAERDAAPPSLAADVPELPAPIRSPESDDAPIRVRRRVPTGERHRGSELRLRANWSWLRPARGLDDFKDLLAAAEDELAEQHDRAVAAHEAELVRD